MPSLVNLTGIPAKAKADIKAVVIAIAPQVLGDKFPDDINKEKIADITTAQVGVLFEAITREFWRQQILAHKANEAAEAARQSAITQVTEDPFG